VDIAHALARLACGGRLDLGQAHARTRLHAQIGGGQRLQRLAAGAHDAGQGDIARLVQAQVRRDNRGQRHSDGLDAVVRLALYSRRAVLDRDVRREGRLRQV